MILGKFMPLHHGHEYLIEFGRRYCHRLHVLVCTRTCEPIDGTLRRQWVHETFSPRGVIVHHVTDDVPQEPGEHPDFWTIWRDLVTRTVGEPIDYVFTSEDYGDPLAGVLGASHVPVDPARELVPVSASAIRADPMRHWDMLPECVRPHFLKRVAIVGPESTGKSTLARDLARHFQTVHVHEYARPLLDTQGGQCFPPDIDRIARGQLAAEAALARHARRLLFCDTNLLLTTIWSEVLFGSCPDWITAAARAQHYDLTLLLDVDVPWVNDGQRYFPAPDARQSFLTRCRQRLDDWHTLHHLISGPWPARFEQACVCVNRVLERQPCGG